MLPARRSALYFFSAPPTSVPPRGSGIARARPSGAIRRQGTLGATGVWLPFSTIGLQLRQNVELDRLSVPEQNRRSHRLVLVGVLVEHLHFHTGPGALARTVGKVVRHLVRRYRRLSVIAEGAVRLLHVGRHLDWSSADSLANSARVLTPKLLGGDWMTTRPQPLGGGTGATPHQVVVDRLLKLRRDLTAVQHDSRDRTCRATSRTPRRRRTAH